MRLNVRLFAHFYISFAVNLHKGPQKKTKRVPKGTSAYQAAWIVDSEEESGDESFEDEEPSHPFEEDAMMMDEHTHVDWQSVKLGNGTENTVSEQDYEESHEEYEEIELEDKEKAFDSTVNPELEEKEYLIFKRCV